MGIFVKGMAVVYEQYGQGRCIGKVSDFFLIEFDKSRPAFHDGMPEYNDGLRGKSGHCYYIHSQDANLKPLFPVGEKVYHKDYGFGTVISYSKTTGKPLVEYVEKPIHGHEGYDNSCFDVRGKDGHCRYERVNGLYKMLDLDGNVRYKFHTYPIISGVEVEDECVIDSVDEDGDLRLVFDNEMHGLHNCEGFFDHDRGRYVLKNRRIYKDMLEYYNFAKENEEMKQEMTENVGCSVTEYKVVKPFTIIDIQNVGPCVREFKKLLIEVAENGWTLNRKISTWSEAERFRTIRDNVTWMIENGFIEEVKPDVRVYGGDFLVDDTHGGMVYQFRYVAKKGDVSGTFKGPGYYVCAESCMKDGAQHKNGAFLSEINKHTLGTLRVVDVKDLDIKLKK